MIWLISMQKKKKLQEMIVSLLHVIFSILIIFRNNILVVTHNAHFITQ